MPLIHINLRIGKSDTYKQAIFDGIAAALHETFNVPKDDQFMTITEHEPANFRFSSTYLGVPRSENVIYVQISAMNSRTQEQKKALYHRISELLSEDPGIRKEDILINIVEGTRENWSLGNGEMQYA